MKLWLISQSINNDYDTYDSAVVVADNELEARTTRPGTVAWGENWHDWCDRPDQVTVEYIGEARDHMPKGVVCASFNAG